MTCLHLRRAPPQYEEHVQDTDAGTAGAHAGDVGRLGGARPPLPGRELPVGLGEHRQSTRHGPASGSRPHSGSPGDHPQPAPRSGVGSPGGVLAAGDRPGRHRRRRGDREHLPGDQMARRRLRDPLAPGRHRPAHRTRPRPVGIGLARAHRRHSPKRLPAHRARLSRPGLPALRARRRALRQAGRPAGPGQTGRWARRVRCHRGRGAGSAGAHRGRRFGEDHLEGTTA